MPAKSPRLSRDSSDTLESLGRAIRKRRKELGVSVIATAEAAAMSRVTLHRIEKGEPSVTIGAYANAMAVVGLRLSAGTAGQSGCGDADAGLRIPAQIRLSEYPQLRQLAWHVQGTDELSARAAWQIYDRNRRHLDTESLEFHERDLIEALEIAMTDLNPAYS